MMVTAHSREELLRQVQESGIGLDGLLIKPVAPSTLHDSIMTALGTDASPRRSVVAGRRARADVESALRGAHILLVEDNVDASEMLKMVLCSEGHTVVAAFDGITGLALACSGAFDVLLCDIGLPGMSGYDLVRNMRVSAGLEAPFCVAVSGYGQIEDRAMALAAGFDQHMVKPVDLATLLALVAAAPLIVPHVC